MSDLDPLKAVAAGYDLLASRWGEWADAVRPPLREKYTAWLDSRLPDGSEVLELGCGIGRPVAAMLAARHNYVGVDLSPAMTAVAARDVTAGRFEVSDMRRMRRPAASLDAVLAFCSIIHVPQADQPALFRSIRRWLRPGGYFIASLTVDDLAAGWEDDWLDAGPMFWSGFDAGTNLQLLTEAGLSVIQAEVIEQLEGDDPVRFQWITAQRSDSG